MWHDWALFNWGGDHTDDDNQPLLVPGQIVFFLELPPAAVGIDVASEMTISQPGMYALIETLEDPLPLPDLYTEIVVSSTKLLSASQQKKGNKMVERHKQQIYFLFLWTQYTNL